MVSSSAQPSRQQRRAQARAAAKVTRTFRPKGLADVISLERFRVTRERMKDMRRFAREAAQAPDSSWNALTRQLVAASPAYFASEILSGPPEAPYLGRFLIAKHHLEWDALVRDYERVCVLAPRDHGKSQFFSFAVPLWRIVNEPGRTGFIFSATLVQAQALLDKIRQEVESNPRLAWLIPAKKTLWSTTGLRFSNGHTIFARGFGTRVRGAHPHYVIVDDGLNDESLYSEAVRRKQVEYFLSAITNMVVPGGQIVVVGTPFANTDLYGELKKNPRYTWKRYQALVGKYRRPLWPERHPQRELLAKEIEIGSVRFAREFQCDPVADSTSLFPGYLFVGPPTEQPTMRLGAPMSEWELYGITAYVGVDFAMSTSVGADYTVVWTMGVDDKGNRWILDVRRAKGLGFQAQLSLITRVARRYRAALVLVEANQMQRIFGDELQRTTDLPIMAFTTGKAKHTLDKGIPSLRVLLENQKFRIPRGDARSVEVMDAWIEEMRAHQWVGGEVTTVAAHDDMAMACYLCDQAIRSGASFSFSIDAPEGTMADEDLERELLGEPEQDAKPSKTPDGEAAYEVSLVDDDDLAGAGGGYSYYAEESWG